MLCSKYGIDNEEAYKRGKHTWQAGHGGTHSCKIYRLPPKQEPINRLSGQQPRTPI